MPRETVRGWGHEEPFEVKIGWSAERDVQVGVEGVEGRSLYWQLLGSDLAKLGDQVRALTLVAYEDDEALGRALLNTLDVVSAPGGNGVWVTLDRRGCNDLIRFVRRARDQAFGRDE